MNRCLCCGKPLAEAASEQERLSQWHNACVRRFFGTRMLPELDISDAALIRIAEENTTRGLTVPGVQKKMSLFLAKDGEKPRLTLVDYPTGYILKPQTEAYASLPEAEYLVMQMAAATGISTVPHALIRQADGGRPPAYITKRVDRVLPAAKNKPLQRLAMEDFCQLDRRLTENKYLGSYERCARIVSGYSIRPGLDLSELFLRVVFSFAVGNSDMHLKNFSLIETQERSGRYVLSPAYDMLPVNVVVPEDPEQMALTVNGKKRNLRRNDFLKFARMSDIPAEAAGKMIRRVVSLLPTYVQLCEESFLPLEMRERLITLMEERIAALEA